MNAMSARTLSMPVDVPVPNVGLVVAVDLAAEHDDAVAGHAAKRERVVERIGEDGQAGAADELVGQRGRGGAGIDQDRGPVLHHARRLARDRGFAFGVLAAALRDRRLHHAASRRAAMHDVEMAVIGEQLQIAADGLVRDAEDIGELADAHRAGSAQALHDLVVSPDSKRPNHGRALGVADSSYDGMGAVKDKPTQTTVPQTAHSA